MRPPSYVSTLSRTTHQTVNNLVFFCQFDPNHRLTNRWSAAKDSTVCGFDAVGNLTNTDYAVSTDITLQYDTLNRLTNMVERWEECAPHSIVILRVRTGHAVAGQNLPPRGG